MNRFLLVTLSITMLVSPRVLRMETAHDAPSRADCHKPVVRPFTSVNRSDQH